ncbi:MAG TPA: hydrolase [Candidatus Binatia bacterium]|nr:MAG: hydrolase [Planctomycetes bacterium RBG_16_55_9]HJX09448.1 hydrolase [Candidatus Binatia bacterium]
MLGIANSCLVVVDVQGKLAQLIHNKDSLFKNIRILIQAARILEIPILWCQQCPDALGPTVPDIAQLLTDSEPINKAAFSCCGDDQFNNSLNDLARDQVLLCGIETHVCIYQTALDLLRKGFEVSVIADAVSSRTLENKQIALKQVAAENASITSTEMALFELLRTAEHPKFRQIAKLIK